MNPKDQQTIKGTNPTYVGVWDVELFVIWTFGILDFPLRDHIQIAPRR